MANESVKAGDEILITHYNDEVVSVVAEVVVDVQEGYGEYIKAKHISGNKVELYDDDTVLYVGAGDKFTVLPRKKSALGNTTVNVELGENATELIVKLSQTVADQQRQIDELQSDVQRIVDTLGRGISL